MIQSEQSFQKIVGGIFMIVCFSFFWNFYSNQHLEAQMPSFLYTFDSFLSFLYRPAWLASYLECFLTQFYLLKGGAAAVITFLLLVFWYLAMRILRKFGAGNMIAVYALFPVGLEWYLLCESDYSIDSTIASIFAFLFFLVYLKGHKIKGLTYWVFIALLLMYSLIGEYIVAFSLLVVFYESRKRKHRWGYCFMLLLVSFLYPFLISFWYTLSLDQAFTNLSLGYEGYGNFLPVSFFWILLFIQGIGKIRRIRL